MSEQDPGQRPRSVDDARLDSLEQRLEQVKHRENVRTGREAAKPDGGYRLGNRVLAALIGGIAGGALIGWVLDRLIGTSPWLLIVMLFLGIAAAFRNIIRITGERPE
ncbi:AtpZ/AtpI family protein [Stakelama pacifica]|uniref:ATP synthase protein I n=1 Tax=Stakelama pacifica TaxID=517720 RepID=A0A4R6FQ94_9SPHN|nr:AtpZ/AtpI family protein [Stakelama pacifica]TDN83687.1 ATP synthase protein I [Stakelama pacifica]GGO94525.1 ATP synthase protein I [Stakelama pacifica]